MYLSIRIHSRSRWPTLSRYLLLNIIIAKRSDFMVIAKINVLFTQMWTNVQPQQTIVNSNVKISSVHSCAFVQKDIHRWAWVMIAVISTNVSYPQKHVKMDIASISKEATAATASQALNRAMIAKIVLVTLLHSFWNTFKYIVWT